MQAVATLLAVTVGAFLVGLMLDALLRPRVSWWRWWYAPALVGAAGLTAWIWTFVLLWHGYYSDVESVDWTFFLFPLIVLVPIIASGGGVIVHEWLVSPSGNMKRRVLLSAYLAFLAILCALNGLLSASAAYTLHDYYAGWTPLIGWPIGFFGFIALSLIAMGLTPFVRPAWFETANVALAPLAILVMAANFIFMVSASST